MANKTCNKCGMEQPVTEFFKSGKNKSGKEKIRGDCKTCAKKSTREWQIKNKSEYNNYMASWRAKNPSKQHSAEIKRRYGLTILEYDQILINQGYRCKICDKKHDPLTKRGRLYVDHDHSTRRVRGLLCGKCNVAIGNFDDNVKLLEKAIEYLKT
jgi:hypothetical protein